MNKKNIMFVVPTLIGGGAEKTVANLSNYLIEYYNIYIVIIFYMNYKDAPNLRKMAVAVCMVELNL